MLSYAGKDNVGNGPTAGSASISSLSMPVRDDSDTDLKDSVDNEKKEEENDEVISHSAPVSSLRDSTSSSNMANAFAPRPSPSPSPPPSSSPLPLPLKTDSSSPLAQHRKTKNNRDGSDRSKLHNVDHGSNETPPSPVRHTVLQRGDSGRRKRSVSRKESPSRVCAVLSYLSFHNCFLSLSLSLLRSVISSNPI